MAIKAPELDKGVVPEVPWPEFQARFFHDWSNGGEGQHVSAVGRTRSGKTTTITQMLDGRKYVVVLLTKRRDPLYAKFRQRGYKIVNDISEWPSRDWHPKIAIHIPTEGLTKLAALRQGNTIRRVLDEVWSRGDLDLFVDEISELHDLLGLETELRTFYKEAGSSNVSVWAGTQKGVRAPREMYDQPRFLFFWPTRNRDELKRIADMNASDPELARQIVAQLDRYEVLVVDAWEDVMVRVRPPKL